MKPIHRILSKEEDLNYGECAVCGRTRLKKKGNYYACRLSQWRWRQTKEVRRLKKHKVTEVEYQTLWVKQGRCCAICRKTPELVIFHIDHDHKTGKVRGILCRACNLMLGMAKDQPDTLRNGAAYLEEA